MAPADRYLLWACRTGYAGDVAEIVARAGGVLEALVDNLDDPADDVAAPPAGYGPVVRPANITPESAAGVVIPLLTPGHRRAVVDEVRSFGLARFPVLVDPTATVASTTTLGEGTVVNAGTVLGAGGRVGRFVHVNRSASVGHDAVVQDFVSIGPGAVLCGGVTLRRGAFVGAGAVLAPNVTVGANAVVGAGAVVVGDVPECSTVAGNPARVVRAGIRGYGDVGV